MSADKSDERIQFSSLKRPFRFRRFCELREQRAQTNTPLSKAKLSIFEIDKAARQISRTKAVAKQMKLISVQNRYLARLHLLRLLQLKKAR